MLSSRDKALPGVPGDDRAAQEACDAIYGRMSDLFSRMLDLKPSTLEGYGAMASAVVGYCWSGEIREGDATDQQLIAAMLSGLAGVPIAA